MDFFIDTVYFFFRSVSKSIVNVFVQHEPEGTFTREETSLIKCLNLFFTLVRLLQIDLLQCLRYYVRDNGHYA